MLDSALQRDQVKREDIHPAWLRANTRELESETCKILTKKVASLLTISQLDEEVGCFIPISIVELDGLLCAKGGSPLLFLVKVE